MAADISLRHTRTALPEGQRDDVRSVQCRCGAEQLAHRSPKVYQDDLLREGHYRHNTVKGWHCGARYIIEQMFCFVNLKVRDFFQHPQILEG
jgi:hypothetical protein